MHTLTVDEMPSHSHIYRWGQANVAAGTIYVMYPAGWGGANLTDAAGGGQAHNNLQPYITCYMWKRVQ